MDVHSALWHRRENGVVEVEIIPLEQASTAKVRHLVAETRLYTWHPPYQIACRLLDGFRLCLECWVDHDGLKRFRPHGSVAEFVFAASLGGHAILVDRGEANYQSLLPYWDAHLFNQHIRSTREYLGPTIKLGTALHIASKGRPDSVTTDVLPEDLGLDSRGCGERWTQARLSEKGLHAVQAAGRQSPSLDEIVFYGLAAAARTNPRSLELDKVEGVLRMGLFTLESACPKSIRAALPYVAQQVRASIRDHANDSPEEYARWAVDSRSNLVHRIAKRRDCPLDRTGVRMALAELGWESFKVLGRTFDVQMRVFRNALPEPLRDDENAIFEGAYLARPELGGLPLLILRDRFRALQPAALAIWENPGDQQEMAVLHTLLEYYVKIIHKRRDADRRYKRQSPRGGTDMQEATRSSSAQAPLFRDIVRELARVRNLPCDVGDGEWEGEIVKELEDGTFLLSLTCSDHGINATFTVTHKELEHAARRLAEQRDQIG